jgi:hypothetical protein
MTIDISKEKEELIKPLKKLKNLNINLYDSLFYLADHKKLAWLLVLFIYFVFPFISFILSPFISIFYFL